MPYQYPQIDLPSIFLAAQQMKQMQEQSKLNALRLAEEERQAATNRWLPQARTDYLTGDPTDLQRLAPQEFAMMEQASRQRATAAAEEKQAKQQFVWKRQEMARAREIPTAREVVGTIAAIKQNPGAFKLYQARLAGLAEQGAINPVQLPEDGDLLDQMEAMESKKLELPPTDLMREAQFAAGPGEAAQIARLNLNRPPSAGAVINIGKDGGVALNRDVAGRQQTSVLSDTAVLEELEAMDRAVQAAGGVDSLLTYRAQSKAWLAGKLDKISPNLTSDETRSIITAQQSFRSVIAAIRNKILNEFYGGAVTPGEMERGLQMLPDDSDSPAEFKAKYEAMKSRVRRSQTRGVKALVEGISTENQANDAGGDRVEKRNAIIKAGVNAQRPKAEILDQLRARDLITPTEERELMRQLGAVQ